MYLPDVLDGVPLPIPLQSFGIDLAVESSCPFCYKLFGCDLDVICFRIHTDLRVGLEGSDHIGGSTRHLKRDTRDIQSAPEEA